MNFEQLITNYSYLVAQTFKKPPIPRCKPDLCKFTFTSLTPIDEYYYTGC
jgi:hypothetical protein